MSFADKFNLFNEFNILRIACAVFFIPHIIGKFTVPATLEFFVKAGFKPPATWMYIAGTIETFLSIGLFLRHLHSTMWLSSPSSICSSPPPRPIKVTKMLDLGHRWRRILHFLGDLLSGGRHARLSCRNLSSPH